MANPGFLRDIGGGTLGPGVQAGLHISGEGSYSVFAYQGVIYRFSDRLLSSYILVDSHCLSSYSFFFQFRHTEL